MRLLGQISILKCSVLGPEPLLSALLNSSELSSFSSLPRAYVFMRLSYGNAGGSKEWREMQAGQLDGQSLSSFSPPSIEDISASLGAHSG
jgi:hypothetical protein